MGSRRKNLRTALAVMAVVFSGVITSPGQAAPGDWVKGLRSLPPQPQPTSIKLPSETPPSHYSEEWAQQSPDQRFVYNVSSPELIPLSHFNDSSGKKPTIILLPGGAFQYLAMDNEGYNVAKRLTPLGLNVFILKYRTRPIAGGYSGFKGVLTDIFMKGGAARENFEPDTQRAVQDTQAALRFLRQNASQWHVDPAHIGLLGFSAGSMTVLAAVQAGQGDTRPDFIAMLYGPTQSDRIPDNPPPLFAAIAADDRIFKSQSLSLIENWRKSGASTELHFFSGGGHGFASQPHGTTSDLWFPEFAAWLKSSAGICCITDAAQIH